MSGPRSRASLDIAENIFLDREQRRGGVARTRLRLLDKARCAGTLAAVPGPARTCARRLVIMDEPTAAPG